MKTWILATVGHLMKWPPNVSLKAVISQPLLSHVLDPYKGNHPGVWKCKKKKNGYP